MPSYQLNAKFYSSSGSSSQWVSKSVSASSAKLSNNNLNIDVGPLKMKYDKHWTVEFEDNDLRVSLKGEQLDRIDYPHHSTDYGDGNTYESLVLTMKTELTLKSTGQTLSGTALLFHVRSSLKVYQFASHVDSVFFKSLNNERTTTMFLMKAATPKEYKHKPVIIASLSNVLDSVLSFDQVDVEYDQVSVDKKSGYGVPKLVKVTGKGKHQEKQISFKLELSQDKSIEVFDVLGSLTFLLRKAIQTFISKPFVYSYFCKPTLTVDMEGEVRQIDGVSFNEISYISS